MKFSENIINKDFETYSRPYTKIEMLELYVRTNSGITDEEVKRISERMSIKYTDEKLVASFNKVMNLKCRSFAPGLFQLRYNDTHVFN